MDYLQEMFSLAGQIAVITGGAGGIATSQAEGLLNAGAKVVLWGRTLENLEKVQKRLNNPRLFIVHADLNTEEAVIKALEETREMVGIPDVLINAVGGNRGKCPFTELDVEKFEYLLKLNVLTGMVVPTKHFARLWIQEGIKGAIINLASMSSYIPLSGVWAYDAAKAAVMNLTMATANEFAPHGIRVNGIAPGFYLGKQNKNLLVKDEATGELTARGQAVIDRTPFKRFGKMEELNGATIFLASNHASGFITGVTIPVDGGFLIENI